MKSHYFLPPFLNFHVVTTVSAPFRNHEHVIPWISYLALFQLHVSTDFN